MKKTFENEIFTITIENNKIRIENKKFGDVYFARLDENNKLVAQSSLALKYAMNLKNEFGF